jgi:hypothetical protein
VITTLLSLVVLTVLDTAAHAHVANQRTWDVWKSTLKQPDDWTLVDAGLTHDEAVDEAARLMDKAPVGTLYVADETNVSGMFELMTPGNGHRERRPGDTLADVRDQLRSAFRRLRHFEDTATSETKSLTQDTFNKINSQIDEYNLQREDYRSRSGFYPAGAPKLPRLKAGDVRVKLSPSSAAPAPTTSSLPAVKYTAATPYNTPRLVMAEGPKFDTPSKGVAMRILIERATLRRVKAPSKLVAEIRAGND